MAGAAQVDARVPSRRLQGRPGERAGWPACAIGAALLGVGPVPRHSTPCCCLLLAPEPAACLPARAPAPTGDSSSLPRRLPPPVLVRTPPLLFRPTQVLVGDQPVSYEAFCRSMPFSFCSPPFLRRCWWATSPSPTRPTAATPTPTPTSCRSTCEPRSAAVLQMQGAAASLPVRLLLDCCDGAGCRRTICCRLAAVRRLQGQSGCACKRPPPPPRPRPHPTLPPSLASPAALTRRFARRRRRWPPTTACQRSSRTTCLRCWATAAPTGAG